MAAENHTFNEKLPTFSEARPFLSPQISNLIQDDNHLYEDGTAFKGYKRCNPDDASEVLKTGGRSLNFLFQVNKKNKPVKSVNKQSNAMLRPFSGNICLRQSKTGLP